MGPLGFAEWRAKATRYAEFNTKKVKQQPNLGIETHDFAMRSAHVRWFKPMKPPLCGFAISAQMQLGEDGTVPPVWRSHSTLLTQVSVAR